MTEEFPVGWTACTMGDVSRVVGGGTPKVADESNFAVKGHAWLTPADLGGYEEKYIGRGRRDLSEKGLGSSSAKLMPPGTVLMSSRAPIGYVAIAENEIATNQGFKSFVCKENVDPEFVYYWLVHLRPVLETFGSGSTFNEISGSRAKKIPFRYPPLPEQRRIVAKLDEIMAEIKAAKAHLTRAKELLRKFRQSVLNAAVTGKLTQGRPVDTWSQVKLTDLIPDGGIFDGPFGSNLKSVDYTTSGVRVVRLENIGWTTFDDSKKVFISEEKYHTLQRHTVGEGDIIIASFIGDEVRACVLPPIMTAIAKADCFCLRPRLDTVNRQYLVYYLSATPTHTALMAFIHGATRPRINLKQLKSLEVMLPSLSIQDEIVKKVNCMFELSRRVEACLDGISLELTIDSVLSKAFSGELIM